MDGWMDGWIGVERRREVEEESLLIRLSMTLGCRLEGTLDEACEVDVVLKAEACVLSDVGKGDLRSEATNRDPEAEGNREGVRERTGMWNAWAREVLNDV